MTLQRAYTRLMTMMGPAMDRQNLRKLRKMGGSDWQKDRIASDIKARSQGQRRSPPIKNSKNVIAAVI